MAVAERRGWNKANWRGRLLCRGVRLGFVNSGMGWCRGIWVPGVFILGHLQQVEPLLFWNFSNFFTFILGGQFLLPQRANSEKREKSNSRTVWDRAVWVSGVFKLDHLHPFRPILFWQFSISFTFILGGQFLLPQKANSEKGEISQFQN